MVIKEDKQVWYICFLTKKKTGSRASVNEKPAQELNKTVIKRNLKQMYARFKYYIYAADLAEMGS